MTDDVTPRASVLREAEGLITGDRNVAYGTPTQNFSNIAEMWTTRLKHKLKDGETFNATDVADLLVLLKVARNIANPKRDNFVDICGYAACGYETTVPEEKPEAFIPANMASGATTYVNIAQGGIMDPSTIARRLTGEQRMRGDIRE